MSLRWPVVLVLLVIPLAIVIARRFRHKRPRPVFVGESNVLTVLPSYQKMSKRSARLVWAERVVVALMFVGVLLLVARPQAVVTSYNQEKSRDTVLCIDVSGSMKQYIPLALDTLEQIYKQNPTDRYSIVLFAGRGFTVLPLTRDRVAIQQKIDKLRDVYVNQNDPNYSFRGLFGWGTDIGEGLLTAVQRFDDLKTYKTRNIVLMSDLDQIGGDYDPDSNHYLEKAALVPKNRINLFILQPTPEYQYATSPQQIVAATGGQLFKIDQTNAQESAKKLLDQIFVQILNTHTVASLNEADYPYLVLTGLACLALLWTSLVWWRWRYV